MTEPSIWDLSEAIVQRTLAKLAIDERREMNREFAAFSYTGSN